MHAAMIATRRRFAGSVCEADCIFWLSRRQVGIRDFNAEWARKRARILPAFVLQVSAAALRAYRRGPLIQLRLTRISQTE